MKNQSTSLTVRVIGWVCVWILSSGVESLAQDQESARATLVEIVLHTSALSPEQMSGEIQKALASKNAGIRELALSAIMSRASAPRFSRETAARVDWLQDKEWIQPLRPVVVQALQDSERRVRAQAVLTLGNFDFDPDKPNELSPETVRVLSGHYYNELDPKIRVEIVKGLALAGC